METRYGHRMQQQPQPATAKPRRQQSIPGLKVAYGNQKATQSYFGYQQADWEQEPAKAKNPISRLIEAIYHMVTEEAETDRPIGISQLSKTFQASNPTPNNRAMADYRFNHLIDKRG